MKETKETKETKEKVAKTSKKLDDKTRKSKEKFNIKKELKKASNAELFNTLENIELLVLKELESRKPLKVAPGNLVRVYWPSEKSIYHGVVLGTAPNDQVGFWFHNTPWDDIYYTNANNVIEIVKVSVETVPNTHSESCVKVRPAKSTVEEMNRKYLHEYGA